MAGRFEPGEQASIMGRIRGLFRTKNADEPAEEEPAEEPSDEEEPYREPAPVEEPPEEEPAEEVPPPPPLLTPDPPPESSGEVVGTETGDSVGEDEVDTVGDGYQPVETGPGADEDSDATEAGEEIVLGTDEDASITGPGAADELVEADPGPPMPEPPEGRDPYSGVEISEVTDSNIAIDPDAVEHLRDRLDVGPDIDVPPKPEEERDPAEILDRIGGLGPGLPGPQPLSGVDPALAVDASDEPLAFDRGYLPPDGLGVADGDPALGGPDTAARFAQAGRGRGEEADEDLPDVGRPEDPFQADLDQVAEYQPTLEPTDDDSGLELHEDDPVSDAPPDDGGTVDDGGGRLPPDLID